VTQRNYGIIQTGGGNINFQGVVGSGTYNAASAQPAEAVTLGEPHSPSTKADVGVITVLSTETRAVCDMLSRGAGYEKQTGDDGRRFYTATVGTGQDAVRVVATQTLDPGQGPAMIAFERLRAYCAPQTVVLCGIAGGIHPTIDLGDVVVARQVINYDQRREGANSIERRGQAQLVPAAVLYAVNDMFAEHGEPMLVDVVPGQGMGRFRAFGGAIGTGEAVIAHSKSEIRNFLRQYNYKTLAVETEAGGVAQAFYEQVARDSSIRGWLAVRGISDSANEEKNDAYHEIASRNAAAVLERLLPYLKQVR
jgi:adenosylhomocysteine nucleosidase